MISNSIYHSILYFVCLFTTWTGLKYLMEFSPEYRELWEFCWVSVLYTIIGLVFPYMIGKSYKYQYSLTRASVTMQVGFTILLFGLIMGMFGSGAFKEVVESDPTSDDVVKYIILYIPYSLMVCHCVCFIYSNILDNVSFTSAKGRVFVQAAGSFLLCYLLFAGDTLFREIELPLFMGFYGALFSLVFVFTGSFLTAWFGFFLVILFRFLPDKKYVNYDWLFLFIGCVPSFLLVNLVLIRKR